jgi:hypothetical protein
LIISRGRFWPAVEALGSFSNSPLPMVSRPLGFISVSNLPGDGCNQLEFPPLLFFGQRIAASRGSNDCAVGPL